jgi:hypothetical protein
MDMDGGLRRLCHLLRLPDRAGALAIACCVVSAMAIWIAGPRKVRLVPGRL